MVDYQFVTPRLAVGGSIGTTENMRELARAGITHIVNMQVEFDDRCINDGTDIEVLWNGCDDDFLPKSSQLFWQGVRFTLQALESPGTKVFIHCAAGVHRSPLMLLAILRALGYPAEDAMGMIVAARPQADFPPTYLESMEDFMLEFQASPEEVGGSFSPHGHGKKQPHEQNFQKFTKNLNPIP